MSKKNLIRRLDVYDGRVLRDDPVVGLVQGYYQGRDATTVKAWWDQSPGNIKYVTCAFMRFFVNSNLRRFLVWPYSHDALVEAHFDLEEQKIVIDRAVAVKHIAWFCSDRSTILKSWEIGRIPGVQPKERIWNYSCPGDLIDEIRCRTIPELPTLSLLEKPVPRSTEMFDVCVDIPGLPKL